MNDVRIGRVSSPAQWLRLYLLYRRAFPRAERKPFAVIRTMWKRRKTDVWCFSRCGRFAGFAATINGDGLILLDYLAISDSMRGQGIGTCVLRALLEAYAGKGFFVEIEHVCDGAPNFEARMRRKRFYLACGLQPLGVTAVVFGVKMELLGVNCKMNFAQYRDFYREHYSKMAARNVVEA